MGAQPGPARSGARPAFPKNQFAPGLGKTSSRSRQPAQAADRGVERAPPASQPPGGPASTTAIPAAAAAGELPAARRAGLPESANEGGYPKAFPPQVWRGYPGAFSPESRATYPEAFPPQPRGRLPGSPFAQARGRLPGSQPEPARAGERLPAGQRRPPPKAEAGYPEAPSLKSGAGCPQASARAQPSPSRVTRKPAGPRRTTNNTHRSSY